MNSNNLTVTGDATATADQKNFSVIFTDKTATATKGTATATINSTDATKATLIVSGFTQAEDTATAVYTVKNASPDLVAQLSAKVTEKTTNSDYFQITTSVKDASIGPNNNTELTVTVKLLKTPVDGDQSAVIDIDLTASPVQPEA